ncbi:MAG: SDR family NAD(P)-dependent oxidoreductase [Solirubrobacterales bacterium]|nr:SDR family NAD(P)-dependent oxidoreductase [Solirubrobacterales bacterium]
MNAIITGGGGDIGSACARLLAFSGGNVLVVDAELEAAEQVVREINERAEGRAIATAADVSIAADVQRYVAQAATWGPVDVIVHAAGIAGPAAPLHEFDEAEFDRVMAVNARGTFLGLKYALPFVRDGGAIVNIASVSGIAGYPSAGASPDDTAATRTNSAGCSAPRLSCGAARRFSATPAWRRSWRARNCCWPAAGPVSRGSGGAL